jgi:light-regulated signal transduction histidine kinase (bacteriophytochrome)
MDHLLASLSAGAVLLLALLALGLAISLVLLVRARAALRAALRAADLREQAGAQALLQTRAALEAANRDLSALSYTVGHDLRAPLRGIDGFSKLLQAESPRLDGDGAHYLGRVRESAATMGQLFDALLGYLRVAQADLHLEDIDLSAAARAALERVRSAQPERVVEVSIAEGLSGRGDAKLLDAMLGNLLGNAWKFTAGQPGARIEFGVRAQGDGAAAYFVRDNGPGFDMAHAARLFELFHRLHSREEFEGMGAGLATARRIVERHGGRLWAEAEPKRGATFFFTLADK